MQTRGGHVVDVQELTPRCPGAPVRDVRRPRGHGLVVPPDQGRQQVTARDREVVARTVEVGRHRGDPRQAVLPPNGLDAEDPGDLGDRVRVVGRLEVPGQQRVLGDRLRRQARVDARRPEEQQPLDALLERGVHHVGLDAEVVGEELHRVGVVGEDPADLGRGQHDVARPGVGEEVEDRVPVTQVELGRTQPAQVGEPGRLEPPPDGGPDHAPVSRDVRRGVAVERARHEVGRAAHGVAGQSGRSTRSIHGRPSCSSASRSASTMICASRAPSTVAFQPRIFSALDGSPRSASTSEGRR